MSIVIKIIVGFLCLLGISELVWNIILHFLRPKCEDRPVLLVALNGEAGEVEQRLRSADIVTRLIGGTGCDGLLAVDCGMDEEAREVAFQYAENKENIAICTCDELIELLTKK